RPVLPVQLLSVHVRDGHAVPGARDLEGRVRGLVPRRRLLPARRSPVLHRAAPAHRHARRAADVHRGLPQRLVRDAPRRGGGGAARTGRAGNLGLRGADAGLNGKVVLVTGAGSQIGIGRTIALLAGERGANVFANDVVSDDLELTVSQVRAAGGEV